MKKLVFFAFLLFSTISAHAYQACQPVNWVLDSSTYPEYQGTGSVTLSGDVCTSGSNNVNATLQATYDNFGYLPDVFVVNGAFTLTFDIQSSENSSSYSGNDYTATMTLNGGPVNYVTDSDTYAVTYNNVVLYLDSANQIINMSGSITVNEQEYSVENLSSELFRIL